MEKPDIYYGYDAICGWCYGFSPVIEKASEAFKDQINFHIINGGLKTGVEAGPINVVAPYIKAGAYQDVERRTGVKFGRAFIDGTLETGDMILDSVPPAVAMMIAKEHQPEQDFRFGSILNQAIYVDGLDPVNVAGYAPYAEKIGLDGAKFVEQMDDPRYLELAKEEFAVAKQLGISSFPTVIAKVDGQYQLVSRGYVDYPTFAAKLSQLIPEAV